MWRWCSSASRRGGGSKAPKLGSSSSWDWEGEGFVWMLKSDMWPGRFRLASLLWVKHFCLAEYVILGGRRESSCQATCAWPIILGGKVRLARLRDAKMQIQNQVPSSHICMASTIGHHSLVLLLPVSSIWYSIPSVVLFLIYCLGVSSGTFWRSTGMRFPSSRVSSPSLFSSIFPWPPSWILGWVKT